MDFSEILRIASENQGCKEREFPEKRSINTSVGKPKRSQQDKKEKGVKSAAVQAFLKKQELEEKKNAEEAKKKKENLMKIREEKNTVGKLRNMVKRNHTKEAIFEVEGTDKKADKSTTPVTPNTDQQVNGKIEYTKLKCQYAGKERRAIFQNVVRKPVSGQWVPKSEQPEESGNKPDKVSTSDSQKKRDSENKKSSSSKSVSKEHTKDHKQNVKTSSQPTSEKPVKEAEAKKKKKKPQGPPPMSFNDLLKIAQEKKTGPGGAKKVGDKKGPGKKEKLPDRPMTKEEKERWERVHSKEYQEWIKFGKQRPEFCVKEKRKKNKTASPGNNGVSAISDEFVRESDAESSGEDCNRSDSFVRQQEDGKESQSSKTRGLSHADVAQRGQNSKETILKHQGKGTPPVVTKHGISKPSSGPGKALKLKGGPDLVTTDSTSKATSVNKKQVTGISKSNKNSSINSSSQGSSAKRSNYNEVHENVLVCGAPAKSKSGGQNQGHKQPEMSTWDRVYGQHQKIKPGKKKRVIESDEESDPEMDDFIVDEEDDDLDDFIDDSEAMDYSKHIRDIFGYDKKKYQHIDEEDSDDMEVGFGQIEREEKRSAKLGLEEDLLDMKMEEEHKKRKMAIKKMAAKKKKYS